MKRVVTGHRDGKSVVVHNAEITSDEITAHDFGDGYIMSAIWETIGIPEIPIELGDYKTRLPFRFPESGETRVQLAWLPPDKEALERARERGDTMDYDWGAHTTDTVDINIILKGELYIRLDDGAEVPLQQGDFLIQNGTRHAWRNKSNETCILVSFSIGAKRK
jgi:hypothetical protein